jgi:hypothetical protein
MADIGKARIRKKVYKFEMKGRYQYEKHFKVVERPPLERLKDSFRKLMAPKKEEKKAAEAPLAGPSKPPGGFNFVVFGGAILIALIILALGFIYLTTQFTGPSGPFESAAERPILTNTLLDGEIVNAGERGEVSHVAGVFIDYNTTSLDNYTITLTPYKEEIPSEVYVLNSEKVEASTYADFIRELRRNLATRNIILNEITIKQLETIPQGALVIVPSGVVPKELLGVDSRLTMDKLVERGVVVLYIGQPFTQMLDGTLAVSTPQDVLKRLPVSFDETTPLASKGKFSVFQPLYSATGRGWGTDLAYGSVSITKSGDGAFIFVPQTLDGGWRKDAEAAAGNISVIIFDIPWAKPLASSNTYVFTNQTEYAGTRYFYTKPFKATEATIKVDFTGQSSTTKFPVRETLYVTLEKPTVSELYIEGDVKVVPTNLTNNPIRMNAEMKEPEPGQPNMFLVIIDENDSQAQVFPQGPVNIQADRSFDLRIFVDRGEYQVRLIDDESRLYAQTYMKVVSIDVTYTGVLRNKPSVYVFEITMDDQPITLDNVGVVVDGGSYGTHNFSRVSTINLNLERYTGSSQQRLPDGTHEFQFTSAGLKDTVEVTHTTASTIFTQPLFWITAILTLGIVGLGLYFARQEEIYFSIDIPDFPPVARTRIPLSPDVVLSLFQKVNENYRWEYTPLTATEVKNAFKTVFIRGKPIYITDYNVEYLLDDLKKRGTVKEALEYYALTDWEGKAKHSIDYLSLMRKLRDICVNNAVPFTSLNESKKADSVITVVGQQMYLHFFEKGVDAKRLVKGVLRTIGAGITIVIFKNHMEKEHFEQLVSSSATIAPLILKMESNSKSLLLYTTEELEAMIKEFKGV